MELNLKFDEQLLTKVCNKVLDEYEYNGKTIREWADRISNPKTNGDRLRAMNNEELCNEYFRILNHVLGRYTDSRAGLLEWLKQPAE